MGFFDKFFMRKGLTMGNFIPKWVFNRPVLKEWDYQNAVQEGFKKNTLVYSCIDKIAKSVASVDWYVYRKLSDGTYEKIENHPLEALLNKPNPFMSRRDLFTRWTYSMYLGGNSIIFKVRDSKNMPIELWYLPQDTISPVPTPQNFIGKYEYNYDGIKQDILPEEVIHDKFLDPSNVYWGMSPIKSAALLIDSDNEAVEWNKNSMGNRAISDGAFVIDQPLTKDQWEDVKEQIESEHTGSTVGRKFWVLGGGAKWEPMSLSPIEMDFINSKKLNREDICAIFGCPPAVVGFYENATLSNIETARKIFWLDTIIPYLNGIRDTLNRSLTEYGDVYIDYDLSTVQALQENVQEKIANAQSLFNMGIPFNKINTLLDLGFDDIEGGDIGYIPSNLIPTDSIGQAEAPNTAPNPTEAPPVDNTQAPKGIIALNTKSALETNLNGIPKSEIHFLEVKARQRLPYDNRMTNKIKNLFEEMALAVAKNPSNYEKAIDSFEKDWNEILVREWNAVFEDIGRKEYESLIGQMKSFVPFEETKINIFQALFDKTIRDWIRTTCAEKVTGIQKATKTAISKVIGDIEESYQAIGERAPVDSIAKGIKDKFKDFSRYRSYTIARTEVGGAVSSANYQAQHLAQQEVDPKQERVVIKRKWLSALDERTRETHLEAHGQIRGLDEKFIVGDKELTFPREYEANAPGETINCRCETQSVIERVKK